MKLISCLLLFFFIEMHYARQSSSHSKIVRIPLETVRSKTTSKYARSSITLYPHEAALGRITIGEPRQQFYVRVDTGYKDLWIVSNEFEICNPGSQTVFKNNSLYNKEISKTYEQKTTFFNTPKAEIHHSNDGIGWAFGFRGRDTIGIGDTDITSDFLEMTQASKSETKLPDSGIFGLQYHVTEGNIISKYCDKMKLERKFSYYLPKYGSKEYGQLILCKEDESKYVAGTMKYVNEIRETEKSWLIPVTKLEMLDDRGTIEIRRAKAHVDTGAYRIYGPKEDLLQVVDKLANLSISNSPDQKIFCRHTQRFPVLAFYFNETKFIMQQKDYIVEIPNSPGDCLVLLVPKEGLNEWILGEPFLRRYYTVFDMQTHRVGIAQSN